MRSTEERKRKYLNYSMLLFVIIAMIGAVIACLFAPATYDGFQMEPCHKIENSFEVTWGSQQIKTTLSNTINNPNMETIYMTTVLQKEKLGNGDSILIRNRQSRIKVYLDDELLFDSGERFLKPFLLGYGSYWKSILVGNNYGGKTLKIEIHPEYKMNAVSGYLPNIYFGTQSSFMSFILKNTYWYLFLTLALIAVGIYEIIYGIFVFHKDKANGLLFLGLFSVDTGIWLLIECHVLEIFMDNMQVITYLSYVAYGMMPVLLLRFLLSYEEFKDKIYLNLICFSGVLLNFIQLILAWAEICTPFESQWLNRGYLGLTIIGMLAILFSVRRCEKGKRRELYGGILILVVSMILEQGYFVSISKETSGRILVIGLCLFIFKSGVDFLIRETRKQQRIDMEKEILMEMAYTDGMTHLGNRFAYEKEKNKLENQPDTKVMILIADMNGLKQANDNHGHMYGDQIICKTAEILESSFENVGKSFRIGGDEFCVLSVNKDRLVFEECIKNMEANVKVLSSTIKGYGIALGFAEGKADDIDEIFHTADNLMYANKKKMKKEIDRYV